jgi:alpha-beta hydrolase superfamily lysophospholipase
VRRSAWTRECLELADDASDPLRCRFDLRLCLDHRRHSLGVEERSAFELVPDERGVRDHDRERVVDLVGHTGGHRAERGETIGELELLLEPALLGDVAEYHHGSEHVRAVHHGRGTVADDAPRLVRPADRGLFGPMWGPTLQHGIERWRLRTGEMHDVRDRAPDGGRSIDTQQLLGGGVEEGDHGSEVHRDHRVGDRAQRRREPLLSLAKPALHVVPVDRDFDRTPQLGLVDRLHEVRIRRGTLRTIEGAGVRMCGEIDDRDIETIAKQGGRLDAVALPANTNVHQDDIGAPLAGTLERFIPRGRDREGVVAHVFERLGKVTRDDPFVFNDQDGRPLVMAHHEVCSDATRIQVVTRPRRFLRASENHGTQVCDNWTVKLSSRVWPIHYCLRMRETMVLAALGGVATFACGGDSSSTTSVVEGCEGATLLANPADPAAPGPWPVGVRTIRIGNLNVDVWYPAAPGSETAKTTERYDIRKVLPAAEAAKIPDADNPWQECDCYRDLPLDDTHGPYPAIVFVHGTAAFRHQSLPLVTHWASRGFVVIAADHPGLYLADFLGQFCGITPPAQTLSSDVDALIGAIAAPTGDLAFAAGHVDATRIGVIGHSAGGAAAAGAAGKPGVRVVVPMAAARVVAAAPTLESVLYLGGLADEIARWGQVMTAWSSAAKPRRLVGITGGGHLTFSDLCEAKNAEGQDLLQIATEHGVCAAQFAGMLFDCNPAHIEGRKGWDIINYATSSVLEGTLQCHAGSDPKDIRSVYPEVAEYQAEL